MSLITLVDVTCLFGLRWFLLFCYLCCLAIEFGMLTVCFNFVVMRLFRVWVLCIDLPSINWLIVGDNVWSLFLSLLLFELRGNFGCFTMICYLFLCYFGGIAFVLVLLFGFTCWLLWLFYFDLRSFVSCLIGWLFICFLGLIVLVFTFIWLYLIDVVDLFDFADLICWGICFTCYWITLWIDLNMLFLGY